MVAWFRSAVVAIAFIVVCLVIGLYTSSWSANAVSSVGTLAILECQPAVNVTGLVCSRRNTANDPRLPSTCQSLWLIWMVSVGSTAFVVVWVITTDYLLELRHREHEVYNPPAAGMEMTTRTLRHLPIRCSSRFLSVVFVPCFIAPFLWSSVCAPVLESLYGGENPLIPIEGEFHLTALWVVSVVFGIALQVTFVVAGWLSCWCTKERGHDASSLRVITNPVPTHVRIASN